MSDVALYRKYRSATFDAVIGQPQVVDTLKNAIAQDRLSHAYLFTGPRGVGKTSVARLLARAANCLNEDPSNRPCGICENCKVDIGSHLDLIEIDAASNRGIDDARALREKITSAPSMGRYKVYIIDEVHMLTTEAFNALLKTLEEPPSHALFILATTELHKLPETIVSRTQRFTFRPIPKDGMIVHLAQIAKEENISIEEDALALIAQTSRGGFRDAISLLDQVGSSGISHLTVASIRMLLGQSGPELLQDVSTAVWEHNSVQLFRSLDIAMAQGIQPSQFASQLIEYWRESLRSASLSSNAGDIQRTAHAIDLLIPVLRSPWPELSLETALLQAAGEHPEAAATPLTAPKVAPALQPEIVKHSLQPSKPVAPQTSASDQEMWIKSLTQIKQHNNSLYALLRSSTTTQFNGDELILACRFPFHRDRLKEEKNLGVIEQTITRVYGRKFKIIIELDSRPAAVAPPAVDDATSELVSSALEILGGEVVHE